MVDLVNQAKVVATSKNTYSDLDLFLTPHPVTGDITLKTDVEAVKRSVRNIVLTNYYERPFKPNLGTNIRSSLFELDNDRTKHILYDRIVNAIETLEPRVYNVKLQFSNKNDNHLHVSVTYTIRNSSLTNSFEVKIKRTR